MGVFVMIEGLDGSGKGVALEGLKEWATSEDMKILDMKQWWESHDEYPSEAELSSYEAIVTFEPTGSKQGSHVRHTLITNGSTATPAEVAEGFANDRQEHYEKLILPARSKGLHIFQDRGVLSSLAYQSLMDAKLTIDYLVNLEGNWMALENSPDLIIVTDVNPGVAEERLANRSKQDNAVFEHLAFQKKLRDVYNGEEVAELFADRNCTLTFVDTNPPKTPEDTKNQVKSVVAAFLEKHS